jgi:hypothetical protein
MLAKSPAKIAIRPTVLAPVVTRTWHRIEPVTKRAGSDDGATAAGRRGAEMGIASSEPFSQVCRKAFRAPPAAGRSGIALVGFGIYRLIVASVHGLVEPQCRQALSDHLVGRWCDLFNASFNVPLYDLTSTYFEANPPFRRAAHRRGRPRPSHGRTGHWQVHHNAFPGRPARVEAQRQGRHHQPAAVRPPRLLPADGDLCGIELGPHKLSNKSAIYFFAAT